MEYARSWDIPSDEAECASRLDKAPAPTQYQRTYPGPSVAGEVSI